MTEDRFRRKYRELTDDQRACMDRIKDTAETMDMLLTAADLDDGVDHRCIALARTKLEESVMWATKAVT